MLLALLLSHQRRLKRRLRLLMPLLLFKLKLPFKASTQIEVPDTFLMEVEAVVVVAVVVVAVVEAVEAVEGEVVMSLPFLLEEETLKVVEGEAVRLSRLIMEETVEEVTRLVEQVEAGASRSHWSKRHGCKPSGESRFRRQHFDSL